MLAETELENRKATDKRGQNPKCLMTKDCKITPIVIHTHTDMFFSSQKTWNTHFPTKLPLRLMVLLTNCFLLTAFYLSCFWKGTAIPETQILCIRSIQHRPWHKVVFKMPKFQWNYCDLVCDGDTNVQWLKLWTLALYVFLKHIF